MNATNTTSSFAHWFASPQPNSQAALRLFCFPYAGGGILPYKNWPPFLPANVEVCILKLPGRESRFSEPPYRCLSTLIQTLAPILQPYLEQPFAFFGHSLGGLISFELTRQLIKDYGLSPVHLFISGRRAPQLTTTDAPIHALPEVEFRERLRDLNGTPKAVLENEELMALVSPTLRADFEMLETYQYSTAPPLTCPISAFGGLVDPEAKVSELETWRSQTSATFSLQMFPGDHFFLQSARALLLKSLSHHLLSYLASADDHARLSN